MSTQVTPITPVTIVLDGCAVVTMDRQGSEYARGHVVVTGKVITAVGPEVRRQTASPALRTGTGSTEHRQAHRR